MLPKKRQPVHPGKILLKYFLEERSITQAEFVRHLGGSWTPSKLNEIVRGKRGITPETAIELALALGVTPEFWLNLQRNYDLWIAIQCARDIPPFQIAV